MAEMKPETKIQRIVEKMKPLADWYMQYKPDVDTLRLPADDLSLIKDHETAAILCGIYTRDGEITYGKFKLRSA